MRASSLFAGLLEMLAPRACAACAIVLEANDEVFCGGCALLVERSSAREGTFVYGGPVGDALRALKYGGRSELGPLLGRLWASALAPPEVDVVVPIPLHPSRLRARGYNQAALLAAPIARLLGVPLDVARLKRARATPPQAELSREQRLGNVRGAFASRPDPRRPRVLLVDDVRTTGATLAAAAEALRRGGASEVLALAMAVADQAES